MYPFVMKKVFKWSEVHLAEVTSYKIHTLGCQVPTKLKQTKSSLWLFVQFLTLPQSQIFVWKDFVMG